jgi:hypothetical protein
MPNKPIYPPQEHVLRLAALIFDLGERQEFNAPLLTIADAVRALGERQKKALPTYTYKHEIDAAEQDIVDTEAWLAVHALYAEQADTIPPSSDTNPESEQSAEGLGSIQPEEQRKLIVGVDFASGESIQTITFSEQVGNERKLLTSMQMKPGEDPRAFVCRLAESDACKPLARALSQALDIADTLIASNLEIGDGCLP